MFGIGSVMDNRPLIDENMMTGMPVFSVNLDSFFGRLAYDVLGLFGMHVMHVPENYHPALRRSMTLMQTKGTPHFESNKVRFGYTPLLPDGLFGRNRQQPRQATPLRAFEPYAHESDTLHSERLPAVYEALARQQGVRSVKTFDGVFDYNGIRCHGYRDSDTVYLNTNGTDAEVRARLAHELFENPYVLHEEVGRRTYEWALRNDPEAAPYIAKHNRRLD